MSNCFFFLFYCFYNSNVNITNHATYGPIVEKIHHRKKVVCVCKARNVDLKYMKLRYMYITSLAILEITDYLFSLRGDRTRDLTRCTHTLLLYLGRIHRIVYF